MALGALLFAGSLADDGYDGLARPDRRARLRGARLAAVGGLLGARRHAGCRTPAAALLDRLRRRRRAGARGLAIFVPPVSILDRSRLPRRCCSRGRRARGREVRRPAHPALTRARRPKKLVLAVIDSLKPEMLERAIEEGRAPALAAIARARHLRARLRVDVPVGHAGGAPRAIATGARPDEHHIPSMNWYHRGERALRRVRLVASRPRAPSASCARSTTPSTT